MYNLPIIKIILSLIGTGIVFLLSSLGVFLMASGEQNIIFAVSPLIGVLSYLTARYASGRKGLSLSTSIVFGFLFMLALEVGEAIRAGILRNIAETDNIIRSTYKINEPNFLIPVIAFGLMVLVTIILNNQWKDKNKP